MCEYCQKYPHDPRCPNAPEKVYYCPVCDEEIDGDTGIYIDNKTGEITGCECCQSKRSAVFCL